MPTTHQRKQTALTTIASLVPRICAMSVPDPADVGHDGILRDIAAIADALDLPVAEVMESIEYEVCVNNVPAPKLSAGTAIDRLLRVGLLANRLGTPTADVEAMTTDLVEAAFALGVASARLK